MQEFRRFIRGPVGKVLLAAIVIPFVAIPFVDYFSTSSSANTVAEVEGNKISRAYLNARVERVRDMLRQQSPNVDPSMLDSFVRPEMVLEGVINEQLILAAANEASMVYSKKQAAKEIYRTQQFQQNGEFSEQQFERTVRSQGMTPQSYMEGLRQDKVTQQFRSAFVQSDFALPVELEEQRRLGEQKRDIAYVKLAVKDLRDQFTISDEDVKAYYQDNQQQFMRPEQLKVAYVELKPGTFAGQVRLTDEEVREEYKARLAIQEQAAGSRRKVAHIMVAINDERDEDEALERALQARRAIQDGAEFGEVAAEYSDDIATAKNGGSLGVVSKGALPESLEEAVAELKSGEVSRPVLSDSGIHLMKVESESRSEDMPTFAEMEQQIRADLRNAKADALLQENAAQLEELLFEHSDLAMPAEQVGVAIESSDWFALATAPQPLSHPKVQQALNSAEVREQGHNSDLIEISPSHYMALRLTGTKPAEPMPLEEVAGSIRQRLKAQRASEQAQQLADEANEALEQGADLETLAELFNTGISYQESLQRGGSEPAMEVVNEAFAVARPEEGQHSEPKLTRLRNGDVVAFKVTDVVDGSVADLGEEQQKGALAELGNIEGRRSFRQVVSWLRDNGDVEIFSSRISGQPQQ